MQLHQTRINDADEWNDALATLPQAHVLQTWQWGDFKAQTTGWSPEHLAFLNRGNIVALAMVLTRQQGPFKIMYVPKGPTLDWSNQPLRAAVLDALKAYAEAQNAIFIKIDPDVVVGTGIPGQPDAVNIANGLQVIEEWKQAGLVFSKEQIQFRNSVVIDLRRAEEDVLMTMKQKTRYNARLSKRKNVEFRFGDKDDMDILYELYAETAERDQFLIRPLSYYRKAWAAFMDAGLAQPIIASYKGVPIAHVILFGFGKRAWYFYGASSDAERNRMPTYGLQWEAIMWARAQNMDSYDMWGAPDDFYDENDPLAGVYRFKSGFGGTVVRRIGAWDYPANPRMYAFYTRAMPIYIDALKAIGKLRKRS